MFPCSGCGACCRRVDKLVEKLGAGHLDPESPLYFPYQWNKEGHCEQLTEEGRCAVYEGRPLICNVDGLLPMLTIPKSEYYALNKAACNQMMDEDGIPLTFRI